MHIQRKIVRVMYLVQLYHYFSFQLHIALESAHGLFQPKTINYMLYCLAAWVVIFLGFVLWEFVYWRPKHKLKKQGMKML